jgi:hypothetical protein
VSVEPFPPATPEAFFEGHPVALAVYQAVSAACSDEGPASIRVTRSQVAFRGRRGYAFLWLPGRWLRRPAVDVVLSIALDRRLESPRFKEIVHPAPAVWIHHLEVASVDVIDDEVVGWLREARRRAG